MVAESAPWSSLTPKVSTASVLDGWRGENKCGDARQAGTGAQRFRQVLFRRSSPDTIIAETDAASGEITWQNGDHYVGELKDGKPHGQGSLFMYAAGGKIRQANTPGSYIGIYVGSFVSGKKHGHGSFSHANGDEYVGSFVNGSKHGHGSYSYANGDLYVGNFEKGKRNGSGTYTWADGERYIGSFVDGEKSGWGTVQYTNGECYEGSFANDKKNGQGTYIWTDGMRCTDYFVDGKLSSQGEPVAAEHEARSTRLTSELLAFSKLKVRSTLHERDVIARWLKAAGLKQT